MNPQFLYTILFFAPFVLLIILGFLIAKKLIKFALFIFVIALILFFGFSIKISPLDYFFSYNQQVDAKSINLGKYTITFGQTPSEKLYHSYIKIYDNETKKENTIEFDPESGKYWNVQITTEGNNICFNNSSTKLFCIDKTSWNINYNNITTNLKDIVK
ncbi:MAG: hypothetical protein QMB51_00805 [Patescibacteria group bacterium]